MHRKPEAKKWDPVFFCQVKGSPWNLAAVAAREVPSAGPMMIQRERRMYITKAMILEHGITKGCDSCLGIGAKRPDDCRDRFEEMYGFTMPTEAQREKDKDEKVQEQTAPATDGIEREVPGGDDDDMSMQDPENEKAATSSTSPPTATYYSPYENYVYCYGNLTFYSYLGNYRAQEVRRTDCEPGGVSSQAHQDRRTRGPRMPRCSRCCRH